MTLAPRLNEDANLTTDQIVEAAKLGTPVYVYDEARIRSHCRNVLAMPNAYGIKPRFAMKSNSSRAILQIVTSEGIGIDASSLNEVRRAVAAGVPAGNIMLTTQEVPLGIDRDDLEKLLLDGLRYNVCSRRQLELVADFAATNKIPLSMRVHPGVGSGESATRNTGDKYSCFGVHLSIIEEVIEFADTKGVVIDGVHVHIGSGGDPEKWRENIDRELGFVGDYFPNATHVSFGGGFKVARMPGETAADIEYLGNYAKQRFTEFYEKTGRKLTMEVEPGTYIVANSGFLVTTMIDCKRTGEDGFEFLIANGGMEVNTRPLLYGSEHPFYVVSQAGELLSSEFSLDAFGEEDERIVVGRCCESGDSQSLDEHGHIVPRRMARPALGDFIVIGGCGAYCSSMTPFNYNSHCQAPEILAREDGSLLVVRQTQKIEQLWQNETGIA